MKRLISGGIAAWDRERGASADKRASCDDRPRECRQEFSATSAAKATLLSDLVSADTFLRCQSNQPIRSRLPSSLRLSPCRSTPLSQPRRRRGQNFFTAAVMTIAGNWSWRYVGTLSIFGFQCQRRRREHFSGLLHKRVVRDRGQYHGRFCSTIFQNEHVKIATYGAGPKVTWRQRQWEPWLHGIFGGAHIQPQVAGHSRTPTSSKLVVGRTIVGTRAFRSAWKATTCARDFSANRRTTSSSREESYSISKRRNSKIGPLSQLPEEFFLPR